MISEEVCGRWRWGKEKMEEGLNKGLVTFSKSNDKWVAYEKIYEGEKNTKKYNTWVDSIGTDSSINILKDLFGEKVFDYPKPVKLIKLFTKMANITENDIVLDFFSGSATTAHAVMQLNAEDGGNRKFIMVQLPEETDEKSEAYKAGYKNICEIGKERIRRAGAKIKAECEEKIEDYKSKVRVMENSPHQKIWPVNIEEDEPNPIPDVGFRVLKLDSSNMKDVYYNSSDYSRDLFDTLTDNIKEDRTPEDLLFQVMLDLGVLLSSKIEESVIDGKRVFIVGDYDVEMEIRPWIITCFDENVTEETIKTIAKMQPYYFVMRDSSMANDSVATNFDQLFATYSPDTVRKVL
jgi:adenine-specific DNA-methyltransferase